ncbi:Glycosyltransferase involved in cell wall bisynthesis [Desulfocicer vacuolatum DSM 3385]|uniref:Glycosyltransferase involved in cell wall bisynthesis n=1 Tax=Desulfocicer vacuolatum DSM 3385 TaxID=1121400 RepID=A0A1W2DLZ6_9BACT|nr:glycosyltransferase family 2 protein [Desulfocicer vacuolatum]SMC98058.1 Glycosyltransferase involved in cell wall bisynthesis [Desulfocicer vacuolatum DSM 3385]
MPKKYAKGIIPLTPGFQDQVLTIIVPVYNEAQVIASFHERLETALDNTPVRRTEIIYINDGSKDSSMSILTRIVGNNVNVELIEFSRNFGKEAAMSAGLNLANGDAVIIIDADLQDPPELIPEMVRQWFQGYDVVNMRRSSRAGETFFKKKTARIFYWLIALLGPVKMPEDVGDFRLLSRRAVDALKQLPERNRFMKGLFAWVGFSVTEISYRRDPRFAGNTKWNYLGLFNLAVEGITSYTVTPLRFSSYLGLMVSVGVFGYGLFTFLKTLLYGDPVQGFPTLMLFILFLGGMQLLAIGIVGEYIGRIFMETKNRPLYIIKNHIDGTATSFSSANNIPKRSLL